MGLYKEAYFYERININTFLKKKLGTIITLYTLSLIGLYTIILDVGYVDSEACFLKGNQWVMMKMIETILKKSMARNDHV